MAQDRHTLYPWEEKLALDEVEGMMRHYLMDDVASMPTYEVLIVPQSEPQIGSVRTLLPRPRRSRSAADGCSVGHYYSANYAEMVCQKYIALGLFTTLVTPDQAVEPLQPHGAGWTGTRPAKDSDPPATGIRRPLPPLVT